MKQAVSIQRALSSMALAVCICLTCAVLADMPAYADESSATSIEGASVTLPASVYAHTGSAITPTPTVTLSGETLTAGTDYTVSYADNTDIGTATVTVTGTGDYTGTATATFEIVEQYTVKTTVKKTYSLTVNSSVGHLSSSNRALESVYVARPKITTTTVTTTKRTNNVTGKVTTSTKTKKSTKKYSLTVWASVVGSGWKRGKLGSSGMGWTVRATGGAAIQAVKIVPSATFKQAMKNTGTSLWYRATCRTFGTLDWGTSGQSVGSIGQERPMTGLVVKSRSSRSAPGDTELHFVSKPTVSYKVRMSGKSSWQSAKRNGSCAGEQRWSAGMAGVAAKVTGSSWSGSILYSIRCSKSDSKSAWSEWSSDYDELSKGQKVRALRVKLTGAMARYYTVWYRVHCGDWGWLDWAKSGQKTGSWRINYTIGGVEIVLRAKDTGAPGATKARYKNKVAATGSALVMLRKAMSYKSDTSWLILVDKSSCRVGIFEGFQHGWRLRQYWRCTPGASSTPTIGGTFTVSDRGYSFGTDDYTCYYWTRFRGNYLFHSVLYYPGTKTVKDGRLGMRLSHGCVRLYTANAKWIYDKMPRGTKVIVYG